MIVCRDCDGDGIVIAEWDDDAYENIEKTCETCRGTGQVSKRIMSDTKLPVKELRKLEAEVKRFVLTHGITCPESVYQQDSVAIGATTLIEKLVNVVGYFKFEEDEEA